jgi:hypothetical protein
MRNYFKMQALRIYPLQAFPPPPHIDPNTFYVVFGGTDDDLFARQVALTQLVGGDFSYGLPTIIWFELDQQFFSNLLAQASGQIWTQTHLNDIFPSDPNTPLLYDQTRVEIEGSPRSTWSHGH